MSNDRILAITIIAGAFLDFILVLVLSSLVTTAALPAWGA